MEIGHATKRTGKAKAGDDQNQNHFEPGEEELEIPRFLDAQVVEPGDKPGGKDGEDLRPGDQNRSTEHDPIEPCEGGEDAHNSGQAGGDAGDGGRLGYRKPRPHVEKRGQVAVGVAQEDILPAGPRHHGAKLRVGHGAKERQHSTDDPSQVHHPAGADGAHHLLGHEEDAAADDGAHHNRGRVPDAEHAGKVRCRGHYARAPMGTR